MSIQNINQFYIPRQNYGFVSVPQMQQFIYPSVQNPYSASFYNQNINFPYLPFFQVQNHFPPILQDCSDPRI